MEFLRWGWVILAIVFLVMEMFTAGFVLASFGIGAAVAALLGFLGLGLPWQLGAFIVVSLVCVFLSKPFADKVTGEQAQNVGVDRVIGKRAVVIETIDPISASGRVRVERETWRAESIEGITIDVDKHVEVVEVQGTRLRVKLIEE